MLIKWIPNNWYAWAFIRQSWMAKLNTRTINSSIRSHILHTFPKSYSGSVRVCCLCADIIDKMFRMEFLNEFSRSLAWRDIQQLQELCKQSKEIREDMCDAWIIKLYKVTVMDVAKLPWKIFDVWWKKRENIEYLLRPYKFTSSTILTDVMTKIPSKFYRSVHRMYTYILNTLCRRV